MPNWKKIQLRNRLRRQGRRAPQLTVAQILAWADQHHARTGRWPKQLSGVVSGSLGEKWLNLDAALRQGHRGLPGGSSLARLLAKHRGVRNHLALPQLTDRQILAWADAHHRRHGRWPTQCAGVITEAPNETWNAVNIALLSGLRGLPGGSSLPQLLAQHRGARIHLALPPLASQQILRWADRYYRRHGRWPTHESGPIPEAPGETWLAVESALRNGRRGLVGGSSLAQLLAAERGVRNLQRLPPLTVPQILAWADEHYQRTGRWPQVKSGKVGAAPAETWASIDGALRVGGRGLPGQSSLYEELARHRGVRNRSRLPRLTVARILRWADAHRRQTGRWPQVHSGPVGEAPGETWQHIDASLAKGMRGLLGGSSLAQLLAERRGLRNRSRLPPLRSTQILYWAKAFYRRAGTWPSQYSGAIPEAPGETWLGVHQALYRGGRGLPGGSSLARLLQEHKTKS